MKVIAWLSSLLVAFVGLFSIKKRIEARAIAKQHRRLNKAVRLVEKELKKNDQKIDAIAQAKIETIKKATTEILSRQSTGTDANALIKKVKGSR